MNDRPLPDADLGAARVTRLVGAPRGPVIPSPPQPPGPAEPATGATTTTATGHRASVARCRCGLPNGGEGFDTCVDPEPDDVRTVTVLGQVPGVARWDRGEDGFWYPARTRYQPASAPVPWRALGVCASGRRHRLVPVG